MAAAGYVRGELLKREAEREDRWRKFFSSSDDDDSYEMPDAPVSRELPATDDELIARSRLGRG